MKSADIFAAALDLLDTAGVETEEEGAPILQLLAPGLARAFEALAVGDIEAVDFHRGESTIRVAGFGYLVFRAREVDEGGATVWVHDLLPENSSRIDEALDDGAARVIAAIAQDAIEHSPALLDAIGEKMRSSQRRRNARDAVYLHEGHRERIVTGLRALAEADRKAAEDVAGADHVADPNEERLHAQLRRQADDAEALADRLENANAIIIEEGGAA